MKVFFLENDSLYKIFKTLEKLPITKEVIIYVEENNPLFQHQRRGKQILDIISTRGLKVCFIAKSNKAKRYFQDTNLPHDYQQANKRLTMARTLYLFFFNIKKFHQALYDKKHYTSYLLFALEVFILLIVLYMLYTLILPSTNITITPNFTTENIIYNFRYYPVSDNIFPTLSNQLAIPYYSGSITHTHDLTITSQNALAEQTLAQGTITVYNTTNTQYSIRPQTKFITPAGAMFASDQRFIIPAQTNGIAGQVTISLTALPTDVYGTIQGANGNISTGTTLHIKNLQESYFLKQIYAKSNVAFTGGATISQGSITSGDIVNITQRLEQAIQDTKKDILRAQLDLPNGILLHFDDLITTTTDNIDILQAIGDPGPKIQGSITTTITFRYVKKTDIARSILRYIDQRQTSTETLVDINLPSLTLYEIKDTQGVIYTIPTAVSIIRGYNFDTDANNILQHIKDNIAGQDPDFARKQIINYPEISNATIRIRPPRYQTISTTKSRISFQTKK